jgi:hypothetical protein
MSTAETRPSHTPEEQAALEAAYVEACKNSDAMMLAALVLGYNELARNSEVLADKVFFILHRDTVHRALREHRDGDKWQIEFGPALAPNDEQVAKIEEDLEKATQAMMDAAGVRLATPEGGGK